MSRQLPEVIVTFVFIFTECRYSLLLLLCSYHSNAPLVCVVFRRIPASIRHLLQAESGANDGIALPLVILPVMLIQSIHTGEGTGEVLGKWIYEVWLYQVTNKLADDSQVDSVSVFCLLPSLPFFRFLLPPVMQGLKA